MADVDVDSLSSMSAIALTAVVGAVVLLLVFLCNFVKKGFEKSKVNTQGVALTVTVSLCSFRPACTRDVRSPRQFADFDLGSAVSPRPQ